MRHATDAVESPLLGHAFISGPVWVYYCSKTMKAFSSFVSLPLPLILLAITNIDPARIPIETLSSTLIAHLIGKIIVIH